MFMGIARFTETAQQKIDLDGTERRSINGISNGIRVPRISFRWMKIKSSVHPEGEIVPYIEKVSMYDMKFQNHRNIIWQNWE